MLRRRVVWLAFLGLALPATVCAQRGRQPAPEGGRGYTFDFADGEPISYFLENARRLTLTDVQRSRLMDIRRRLRVTNKSYVARLDSLRDLAGIDLGDANGISGKEREAIARFESWARPTMDSMRVNIDIARVEARSLLDADQQRRLDSIALDDATRMRSARTDRVRDRRPR
ncbi:MAG: hypothetical protein IT361_18450 [Gemmatimonadaceae bacterium]|nr:hypothetical protein [Gemmatimonadaceae bacterium]